MESPGKYLKDERERQELSLKAASKFTRIREHHLRAIEEDRYDLLPSSVYIKGFLTLYAKYLHLDPKEVLLRYQKYIEETHLPKSVEVPQKGVFPKKKVSPWLLYSLIGALSLFITLNLLIKPQEFLNWFSSHPSSLPVKEDGEISMTPQIEKEEAKEGEAKVKETKEAEVREAKGKVDLKKEKESEVKKMETMEGKETEAKPKEVKKIESKEMTPIATLPFEVVEAKIGAGIEREGGRLVMKEEGSTFICDNQRVYFLTIIKAQEEGKVIHVWVWEGKEFFRMELEVKPPLWSTYTYITLRPPYSGAWRAEVRVGDKILSSIGFKAKEADGQSYSGEQ
jgi:cytoskeletal protein RodZ